MLFDLQPITPTIVKVVPAPAREIGVLDVLIGALGLTGVIVLGSVVLGCVLGAIIIGFKRWRAERPYDPLEDESSICGPLDLVGEERAETVARAVQALPPLQREAVILAEYEEISLEEISSATGSELAAVKSRLHRGRQNLRRMLAPLLETEGTTHGTK